MKKILLLFALLLVGCSRQYINIHNGNAGQVEFNKDKMDCDMYSNSMIHTWGVSQNYIQKAFNAHAYWVDWIFFAS